MLRKTLLVSAAHNLVLASERWELGHRILPKLEVVFFQVPQVTSAWLIGLKPIDEGHDEPAMGTSQYSTILKAEYCRC